MRGEFKPSVIPWICQELGVQPNQVFIGCPGSTFEHSLSELGGVRVITHFKRKVEDVGAGETPMLARTRAGSTSNNSEVELVSKGLV